MDSKITVEKLNGGYVVDGKRIFPTTEELLSHLLMWAEGRSRWFGPASFGVVDIRREPAPGEEVDPA